MGAVNFDASHNSLSFPAFVVNALLLKGRRGEGNDCEATCLPFTNCTIGKITVCVGHKSFPIYSAMRGLNGT